MQAAQHQCGFSWRAVSPTFTSWPHVSSPFALSRAVRISASAIEGATRRPAPHAIAARRETVVKFIKVWASELRSTSPARYISAFSQRFQTGVTLSQIRTSLRNRALHEVPVHKENCGKHRCATTWEL